MLATGRSQGLGFSAGDGGVEITGVVKGRWESPSPGQGPGEKEWRVGKGGYKVKMIDSGVLGQRPGLLFSAQGLGHQVGTSSFLRDQPCPSPSHQSTKWSLPVPGSTEDRATG